MNADQFADLQPCLLVYDVPTRLKIANPSGRLRRLAFRINLSCWVIRRTSIPYAYLNRIANQGVKWRVVSFDAGEAANLVSMAIENIKSEIREAVRRAKKADQRAEDARGNNEIGDEDHAKAARTNVKRLKKTLQDLRHAASQFGIHESSIGYADAVASVAAIDAGMKAKCAAYANLATHARKLRTAEGNAIADAVERDLIPAGIAADFVEERCKNGELPAKRARFLFELA